MDIATAEREVYLGASLARVAAGYRQGLIEHFGLLPEDITDETFAGETEAFMRKLCRHLGERYPGDPRVEVALREWVLRVDHYEAWDALLSAFEFEGKEVLVRRGRVLFPGPLTAHWTDRG